MNKEIDCAIKAGTDTAKKAKGALESVCSGKSLAAASRYYGPDFVDHVNGLTFRGLKGVRRSVELYTRLLSNIDIVVEDQFTEGDFVPSRFVVTGNSFGRRVTFNGITISRVRDGLIVEDWSVTDTLSLLRQLGVWRSFLAGVRQWKTMKRWSK